MPKTYVVSMPANTHDGRRKTTKLTAEYVERKEDWIIFFNDEDDIVAEFRGAESWLMEEVAVQGGPRPAE